MSYNETGTLKKRIIAHLLVFRGTASVRFVPVQGIRAQGNSLSLHPRLLSTSPRSSPEPQASYRNTMPLQLIIHGMSLAVVILPLLSKGVFTPNATARFHQIGATVRKILFNVMLRKTRTCIHTQRERPFCSDPFVRCVGRVRQRFEI